MFHTERDAFDTQGNLMDDQGGMAWSGEQIQIFLDEQMRGIAADTGAFFYGIGCSGLVRVCVCRRGGAHQDPGRQQFSSGA